MQTKFWMIIIILTASVKIFAQSENDIIGNWKSEDKDKPMQMEIYKNDNGKYFSRVINDASNKAGNGKIILQELVFDSLSKKYTGAMQPPDANISLNVTVSFENNDRLKVVAKKMLMTKTIYLQRIK